ncbi:DUF5518 domain-containing protein [Halegenticoccus tardaugens]|uniref:DUF5518 domain-containing protein n=1 Tax=Halegenticoccus tardaugens TaxID=2071624 RepID=UPI00100A3C78|nr:DUF5518 domain-containing protein [Halegenticoccus tardaugens]
MTIEWRAVLYGFVVALAIGLLSGAVLPGTDMTLPIVGWGLTGILAGFVAGYAAGGTMGNGAVHGGLSTIVGALVLLLAVTFTGALFAGLVPAVGLFAMGILLIAVYAIPGAIGGAIGSWGKERRTMRRAARPAA